MYSIVFGRLIVCVQLFGTNIRCNECRSFLFDVSSRRSSFNLKIYKRKGEILCSQRNSECKARSQSVCLNEWHCLFKRWQQQQQQGRQLSSAPFICIILWWYVWTCKKEGTRKVKRSFLVVIRWRIFYSSNWLARLSVSNARRRKRVKRKTLLFFHLFYRAK